jgi:hypothetical protein
LFLLCGLIAACDRATPRPQPDPVSLAWSPLSLPMPPGRPGTIALRDATTCGGRWYVVGAVFGLDQSATVVHGPEGDTRPAMWTSTDGTSWTSMMLRPHSFYGERNVVYAAACRDGRLAAIGARAGGAHGNPRVATWRELADGSMDEVVEPFETYGGPVAVKASRMAGGPPGWLIAGERASGASAWLAAPDAADFDLVEGAPELASDARGGTTGDDAVWFDETSGGHWVVVGGVLPADRGDRDPAAWTSPDGRTWQRQSVPGSAGWDELHRVAVTGDALVAVGPRGPSFGAWRYQDGAWRDAAQFGDPGRTGLGAVASLASGTSGVFAMVSDGAHHTLWASTESGQDWRPVALPAAAPAGADRAAAVATLGDRLLLLVDDGKAGLAWMARAAA